jgi:hypothetical protein
MQPEDFFQLGYFLATHTFAERGFPLIEDGKRARYESFEFGPYAGRFGIVGEITSARLSAHDLIFEVDFGSHVVSAQRIHERDALGRQISSRCEWVSCPTDADFVAIKLLG